MNALDHVTSDAPGDQGLARLCTVVLEQPEAVAQEAVTHLAYRDGVRLVTEESPQKDEIAELIDQEITAKAGGSWLDARDLPRAVVPGVELVPSGVVEVVTLQSNGYHYVNVP